VNDNIDRSLTTRQDTALTDPGMRDFAAKLKLLLPNGAKLTEAEALAGAQYAKTTGLDPFRGEFYIVPSIGVVPGYKGVYVRQGQQGREPDYRYRPLTEDEQDFHDIQTGDKAAICYATEPAEAAEARKAGREPRTWEGVGIVRKAEQWVSFEWRDSSGGKRYKAKLPEAQWKERADPPTGKSWGWVAQNRAMKDCANHMGIPVALDAETILAQAQAAGLHIEIPEGAQLCPEQAQEVVIESIREYGRLEQPPTPQELQARSAANVATMRAPAGFQGFGDEPESGGTDGHAPLTSEAPKSQSAGATAQPEPANCQECGQTVAFLGHAPGCSIGKRAERAGNGNGHAPEAPPAAEAQESLSEFDSLPNAAPAVAIRERVVGKKRNDETKAHPDIVKTLKKNLAIAIGSSDERHALTAFMFGSDDPEQWTQGQCMAANTWLGVGKAGDGWAPSARFVDDWKVIKPAIMPAVEIVGK